MSPQVAECSTNNICSVCGEIELTVYRKCDRCDARIFCLGCDDIYHKHPKRQEHIRDEVYLIINYLGLFFQKTYFCLENYFEKPQQHIEDFR